MGNRPGYVTPSLRGASVKVAEIDASCKANEVFFAQATTFFIRSSFFNSLAFFIKHVSHKKPTSAYPDSELRRFRRIGPRTVRPGAESRRADLRMPNEL